MAIKRYNKFFSTILVPKVFKDISGPNYEINTFSFNLPTTVNPTATQNGFKYKSVRNPITVNGANEQDYYNKLPYYVNIVDNNNVSITGKMVDNMSDLKPNSMFGVLFYDKPLMVKPLKAISGPNNIPLYGTEGKFMDMNNFVTAVVYNGIGDTRLYSNDQRIDLFLNDTKYDDSNADNPDTYENTRVERVAYMPIDTSTEPDNPTLLFNPSYGPKQITKILNTNDKTYIDTINKEEVWKYSIYEYGVETGESEYYDKFDNLVSQAEDDPSRYDERGITTTNAAQYIETQLDGVSLVASDDYNTSDEEIVNFGYSTNVGGMYMFGKDSDGISVSSSKLDEDTVTEYHYLFYYMKRDSTSNQSDNNFYYPFPTNQVITTTGNTITNFPEGYDLQDLYKLIDTPKTELDALGGHTIINPITNPGNYMFSITGEGIRNFNYIKNNVKKLKFFILSLYQTNTYEARTISPVITTEQIHVVTNFYKVYNNEGTYDKVNTITNRYVYLVPQYGYKIDDDNIDYNYGRVTFNHSVKYTFNEIEYVFVCDDTTNGKCSAYTDTKHDSEFVPVAVFNIQGVTFSLEFKYANVYLYTRDGQQTPVIDIVLIEGLRYRIAIDKSNKTITLTNGSTNYSATYEKQVNIFNLNSTSIFVTYKNDTNSFQIQCGGNSSEHPEDGGDATFGKFDIGDLDYIENYNFNIGRVNITTPDGASGQASVPNTYYEFTKKEEKTIENDLVKSGRGNVDYKITTIVAVDQPKSDSNYVCNVCRAIRVRVNDFIDLENWMSLYVTDVTNTRHKVNKDIESFVYEIAPDDIPNFNPDGLTTEEFNTFVNQNQGMFNNIFEQLTRNV